MRVLSIAYTAAPVQMDSVGGAEQILALLDEGLVRQGHASAVVACEDSHPAGRLYGFRTATDHLDEHSLRRAQERCRQAVERAIADFRPDLVHMHGLDFPEILPACSPSIPILATLHLPIRWYAESAWSRGFSRLFFNCVSRSQEETAVGIPNLLPFISNGVSVSNSPPALKTRRYVVALGRICPNKNFHEAMDAAAEADVPLILAGKAFPYPEHVAYFEKEIRPRLGPKCRFVGPVCGERKFRLLASAKALLLTSRAPETSSLVSMEALAAGTPVIAYPSGAVPEVVENHRTGMLVNSPSEMARAIREICSIDRLRCYETARAKFNADRMVAQYIQVYQNLAMRHQISLPNSSHPGPACRVS